MKIETPFALAQRALAKGRGQAAGHGRHLGQGWIEAERRVEAQPLGQRIGRRDRSPLRMDWTDARQRRHCRRRNRQRPQNAYVEPVIHGYHHMFTLKAMRFLSRPTSCANKELASGWLRGP